MECAELRAVELRKEVYVCEVEKSTHEEWISERDLVNHDEDLRQQEAFLAEEDIIDDSLRYWTSLDQLDDVKTCIF